MIFLQKVQHPLLLSPTRKHVIGNLFVRPSGFSKYRLSNKSLTNGFVYACHKYEKHIARYCKTKRDRPIDLESDTYYLLIYTVWSEEKKIKACVTCTNFNYFRILYFQIIVHFHK